MKICIISRTLNKKGGISRYNTEIAERLCRFHDVHAITAWHDCLNPQITVHKYSIPRKPFFLQISASFVKVSVLAKKLDEKHRFDIIHSSEAEGLYQDVITAHSCIRAAFKKLRYNNVLYDFLRRINPSTFFGLEAERLVYIKRRYKKIIAVSNGIKRELIEFYNVPKEDVVVIPNGVDPEEFKPDRKKRQKVRGTLNIDENEVVLMFSGYEFKRKGLKYVIEALPKIKNGVKLLVVGKDNPTPYKKLAQKLGVLDKIIFTGFVPDISEYYSASDVFVFPTLYEPFGLVITEAMASGLPVIVSEFAGASEIIKNGYNGFLIKNPTNPNEIAEILNTIIGDDKAMRQMSKNARKTAERYSWDNVTKRLVDVYEEVIKK